ncbi:hypothetical protein BDW69DRAFT_166735 [Aspergillus filifer]
MCVVTEILKLRLLRFRLPNPLSTISSRSLVRLQHLQTALSLSLRKQFTSAEAMAATQKLYPRATVKRIVKAHANRSLSKNADILIFLDYMLFMQELMREASIRSRKSGEKNISPNAVRKVTEKTLRKFKG